MILDIETTGLHRIYSKLILVGIVSLSSSDTNVIQIFANTPKEEYELLLSLKEILLGKNLILTYNGQAFDIPYINSKFEQHNIDFQIPIFKSFDLLRIIRRNKKNLNLIDYKLKSVETFLGIFREDTISGKESVDLYNTYVSTNSNHLKEKILLHNFEDILNIINLFKMFDFCSEKSIFEEFKFPFAFNLKLLESYIFESINISYIRDTSDYSIDIYLDKFDVKSDCLSIIFYAPNFSLYDSFYSNENLSVRYIYQSDILEVEFPILKFETNNIIHIFFDIDCIYSKSIFNNLSINEKLDLNFSINSIIDYTKVANFIKKYFIDIIYFISNKDK